MLFSEIYTRINDLPMTSSKDVSLLAKHLNKFFYPPQESGQAIVTAGLAQAIFNDINEVYNQTIATRGGESFSFSSNLTREVPLSQQKARIESIIQGKQKQQKVTFATLIKNLEVLQNSKFILKSDGSNIDEGSKMATDFYNKLNNYYEQCKNQLQGDESKNWMQKQFGSKLSTKKVTKENWSDVFLEYQTMAYQLTEIVKVIDGAGILPMTVYGDIFEYGLAFLSSQLADNSEEIAKQLDNFVVSGLKGKVTSTGQKVMQGAETDIVERFSSGGVSFNFSISKTKDPFRNRRGKMDILFEMPIEGQIKQFRISAKNWGTIIGGDSPRNFGKTGVGAALVRSIGEIDMINSFIEPILWERKTKRWYNAHALARHSLLVDILMGYSQTNNYADTIVINDRSKKEIKVIAISDIIKAIKADMKIYIQDYDENKIGQIVSFKNYSKNEQPKYNTIYRELLDLKMALRFTDLQAMMRGKPFVYGKDGIAKKS